MTFKFFKKINVAEGKSMCFSKGGTRLGTTPGEQHVTLGAYGTSYTEGISGTGFFWKDDAEATPENSGRSFHPCSSISDLNYTTQPPGSVAREISPGFLSGLFMGSIEKAFRRILVADVLGDQARVLDLAKQLPREPDVALIVGIIHLRQQNFPLAASRLGMAARDENTGQRIKAIRGLENSSLRVKDPETGLSFSYALDAKTARFLLASALRQLGKWAQAAEELSKLNEKDPTNGPVAFCLARTITNWPQATAESLMEVLVATEPALENGNALDTGLLLCRARALRRLRRFERAGQVLGSITRAPKGRPAEMLLAIKYEKALLFMDLERPHCALKTFEEILAVAPHYRDVSHKVKSMPPTEEGAGCEKVMVSVL